MMEEMGQSFCHDLDGRVERWRQYDLLAQQTRWLELAVKRYRNADHPSCICVLYPRIEGGVRGLYAEENTDSDPSAGEMVANLAENHAGHSTLLPGRFEEYLRQVYFRGLSLARGEVARSRHSHAHGVSDAGDYDPIRASVGLMIVDQIAYYLTD